MGFVFDFRIFGKLGFCGLSPFFTSRYKTFSSQMNHPSSWTLSMFVLLCFRLFVARLSVALWSGSAFGLRLLWSTSASLHRSLVGLGGPELLPPAMVGLWFLLHSFSSGLFFAFKTLGNDACCFKLWLSCPVREAFTIDIGGTKKLSMMRIPTKCVVEPQNLPKTLCRWPLFYMLLQVHSPFYNHKRRSFCCFQ